MPKKILLFSGDPGEANCIIPVYKKLRNRKNLSLDLFGKEFSIKLYKREKLHYADINNVRPNVADYNLVVSGAGGARGDATNKILWRNARQNKVPSVAILDSWQYYEERFKQNGKFILPDKICVMDEFAKKEMLGKGFPSNSIVVTGQPYFETIANIYKKITKREREAVLKRLGVESSSYIITFVSEPIIEDRFSRGYTQVTIFEEVIKALRLIAQEHKKKNFTLILKRHPRDDRQILDKYISSCSLPSNIKLVIADDIVPQFLISASSVIIGMASMFLIESAVAGKPYISVQIGLSTEDPFVLSRKKICRAVLSSRELLKVLRKHVIGEKMHYREFIPEKNAVERILKVIEGMLYTL